MARPRTPLPPPPPASLTEAFLTHFSALKDPRRDAHKIRYPLPLILLIVYAAMLCGFTGWEAFEEFAVLRREWLRAHVPFDGDNTPAADTIREVFERLHRATFAACFSRWIASLADTVAGRHLALDGKSLQGARDPDHATVPLHLLHVWLVDQRLLLATVPAEGAPGEPAAIQQTLATLDLEGAVVTADANGTTAAIATKIDAERGTYVLALKGNRHTVYEEIDAWFAPRTAVLGGDFGPDEALSETGDVDHGHGRDELRQAWAVEARHFPKLQAWLPHVRSVLCMERSRRVGGGPVSVETHYFVSNGPAQAARLARFVRDHWSIENTCHRTLDVVLHEDAIPIRKGPGAENLAIVRRHVMTALQRDSTVKGSMPKKMRRATLDDAYRTHLLTLATA